MTFKVNTNLSTSESKLVIDSQFESVKSDNIRVVASH